ncbi:MAG: hypothetical protein GXO66_04005 [Euryarchaeota archaeon]|nr:hypothetical protein [Euryarchaeota archaeon]
MREHPPRALEGALAALGASIELAAPAVLLGLGGYYLGKRYGDAAAFLGMVAGIFAGLAIGVRALITSYVKKP